jgi:hypothetical protein
MFSQREIDFRAVRGGFLRFLNSSNAQSKSPTVPSSSLFRRAPILFGRGFRRDRDGFQICSRFADERIGGKFGVRLAFSLPRKFVNFAARDNRTSSRVAINHRVVKRARFGNFSGAFRIARRPVTGFSAIRRVFVGVSREMFDQHLRRSAKFLLFVFEPREFKLRSGTSTAFG